MSMFDILESAKDMVCLAGSDGIMWIQIAKELSITSGSPIASYVLQRFRQCNYVVEEKPASHTASITTARRTTSPPSREDFYLITASVEDRCRVVGKIE
jgi:hypothetical protein